MFSLLPAFTVLLVLSLSVLIVRVATVALTMTGLSKDLAQFQALSAFTGSGFTTKESEDIVNDPARRRIVMFLMLAGNAGIVLAVSSVLMSLLQTKEQDDWYDSPGARMLLLIAGVLFLILMSRIRLVNDSLWRLNTWSLRKWAHLDIKDYMKLLRLSHDYVVAEIQIHDDYWLAGKSLAESQLASEGVLVLGIERQDGRYVGAPRGVTRIAPEDTLILYSTQERMMDLISRQADIVGNLHHVMAVTQQLDMIESEEDQ